MVGPGKKINQGQDFSQFLVLVVVITGQHAEYLMSEKKYFVWRSEKKIFM